MSLVLLIYLRDIFFNYKIIYYNGVQLMTLVFKCYRCSDCCTFYDPRDYPKVFPWEKRTLEKNASKYYVNKLRFEPEIMYYDPFRDKYIVLLYRWIIGNKCPFNRESKCIIHGKHPLSCKMYPLIVNYSDHTLRVSLQCKWIRDHFNRITSGVNPKNIFPKEFEHAIKTFAVLSLMIEDAKKYGWKIVKRDRIEKITNYIDYDTYIEGDISED